MGDLKKNENREVASQQAPSKMERVLPEAERPTVTPPFDPVAFAREMTARRLTPTGTPTARPPTVAYFTGSPTPRADAGAVTFRPNLAQERSIALSKGPPRNLSPNGLERSNLLSLANAHASFRPVISMEPPQEEGTALGLVSRQVEETRSRLSHDPMTEMRDCFSLGNYTGALAMAESVLGEDPENAEAQRYAENSRTVLQKMFTSRIGPLTKVPVVAVPRDQLRWLSIDHRTGFVLSHIDGVSSLEMILDVSGMPVLDTLRILYNLVQEHVIAFR